MQMLSSVSPEEAALPLRERKKRKTRRLIINTAIELFSARGFDAVTLEDIAAVCDVSRGTVFNYFPYKELMILEFMDAYMSERLAAIRSRLESGFEPTALLWEALDVPKECGRPVADLPLHHGAGAAASRAGSGGCGAAEPHLPAARGGNPRGGTGGGRDPHREQPGGSGALSDRSEPRLDRPQLHAPHRRGPRCPDLEPSAGPHERHPRPIDCLFAPRPPPHRPAASAGRWGGGYLRR